MRLAAIFSILAIASSATVAVAESYTCETSGGSPLLSDVYAAADRLTREGQQRCTVLNSGGNMCTQMNRSGTAAVDICGPEGWWMACYNAGRAIRQVGERCQANINGQVRAGGIFRHDDGVGHITVYRS